MFGQLATRRRPAFLFRRSKGRGRAASMHRLGVESLRIPPGALGNLAGPPDGPR
jgi:hypothetical protein